jgi:hypothetical protein
MLTAEMNRLADLTPDDILDTGGPFIHAMPRVAGYYRGACMPLMCAIRAKSVKSHGPLRSSSNLATFRTRRTTG